MKMIPKFESDKIKLSLQILFYYTDSYSFLFLTSFSPMIPKTIPTTNVPTIIKELKITEFPIPNKTP
jgi:hypothetical protein